MSDNQQLREALARICRLATDALAGLGSPEAENDRDPSTQYEAAASLGCSIKSVPKRLMEKAADRAVRINPMNRPMLNSRLGMDVGFSLDRPAITLLTTKYWGRQQRDLTVSFLDNPSSSLRARIIGHLNAWNRCCGIRFVETSGVGKVRISRGAGGYWSYLGTDILTIPRARPTMNLQGFTMNTEESEYKRVIRHEAGHTLGFPHEHMRGELVARIDRQKAYDYFLRTQGWSRKDVDQQVLTPLGQATIIGTPADQTSIMCYQLPGSITLDGKPILGGVDINATDCRFAGQVYPRANASSSLSEEDLDEFDDEIENDEWDESEREEVTTNGNSADFN